MSTESADSAANPTAPTVPAAPGEVSGLGAAPSTPPVPPAKPQPVDPPAKGKKGKSAGTEALDKVKVTRTSGAWSAIVGGALLLIVILIFIAENTEPTRVHLLLWWVELPLGVLLLFALIIGVLSTALIGGARIFQVWRAARKSHKE